MSTHCMHLVGGASTGGAFSVRGLSLGAFRVCRGSLMTSRAAFTVNRTTDGPTAGLFSKSHAARIVCRKDRGRNTGFICSLKRAVSLGALGMMYESDRVSFPRRTGVSMSASNRG